jgi:hypothetical protein
LVKHPQSQSEIVVRTSDLERVFMSLTLARPFDGSLAGETSDSFTAFGVRRGGGNFPCMVDLIAR